MNRRSSRALRVENFIYQYDLQQNRWVPKNKFVSEDLFNEGVFYTCKKMSQKVNPVGFRLRSNKFWDNLWVSNSKNYNIFFFKDITIRKYLYNIFNNLGFGVSKLLLQRSHNKLFIKIYVKQFKFFARNTIYIQNYRGLRIANFFLKKLSLLSNNYFLRTSTQKVYNPLFFFKLKTKSYITNTFVNNINKDFFKNDFLPKPGKKTKILTSYILFQKYFFKKIIRRKPTITLYKSPFKHLIKLTIERFTNTKVFLSVVEEPLVLNSASLLCDFILNDLRFSRNSFRNVLNNIFKDVSSLKNVKGIRVNCSGRLSKTSTMAQTEWFRIGQIPLTTLSANVDFASGVVKTKNGLCGIKVWIFYN